MTTLQQAIEVQYDENAHWAHHVFLGANTNVVDVDDMPFGPNAGTVDFTRFTFVDGTHPTHAAARPILAIKETRDGGETWMPGEVWDEEKGKIVRANFVDVVDVHAAADYIIEWIREA